MKTKSLFWLAFLIIFPLKAQIFSSGFENNNGTPLSEFTTINNDNLSVPVYAPVPEFEDEAWIQFFDAYDNKIAFSTSWYDPEGQSDDWLITPQIFIPDEGEPTLYWKAKSYDFENLDGYEIRASVTDNNMDSFTDLLFSIEGEQPFDYFSRSLDLSAYKGMNIYLAFINNTVNGFYLALDDLYISQSANCPLPDINGIQVNNLSEDSFQVEWGATSGISDYDTGLTTFTIPVSSDGVQSSLSKSYSNLTPATRYQFFLKNADCGSGWATPTSIWTPAIPPYSYDFEYTEENYGEYDSDGWSSMTWINGSGEAAQNGDGYIFNNTSTTFQKDDWIFSYPIKLDMDQSLKISYYSKMGANDATPGILKVSAATGQDKSLIFEDLDTFDIEGGEYVEYTSLFTADESGIYYFGFGNITPPVEVNSAMRLDNITFEIYSMNTLDSMISEVKIYPNPVTDFLNIESEKEINSIELYNLEGKLLRTFGNEKKLNLSDLAKGVYVIKIRTANEQKVFKILK